MKPEFILMLTYSDRTVENALEIFRECKDTQMKQLVNEMKQAGKTTYLEVVSLSEQEGLAGAKLAVEAGFDILMGTVFYDSILAYLKGKPIKYYPFPGHVHSHPSILDGDIDEIVTHARFLESQGVQGLDLLSYRYVGDAPALLRAVVAATKIPVVSAGSIESTKRLVEVKDAGTWGFTIGSALFDKKFVPNGTFIDNINAVCEWLESNQPSAVSGQPGS
jgi:hypothetical protein